jgi:mono/diheme cytochrome c family protein
MSALALVVALTVGASCGGDSEPAPAPDTVEVSADVGAERARQMGCLACHTTDGNPSVGPTWMGLFGSERTFADGSTARADEPYIRESILDPNAKVVQGFTPGIMPQNFRERLNDPEIASIIEYIKTLQ